MIQFQYNDGGREAAGYKGKTGDCVCRAICIATGKPYQEVYDYLALGNKTQRKGKYNGAGGARTAAKGIMTNRKWFDDYMTSLGFEWVPTMQIGQGFKIHLNAEQLPKGRLVVKVKRHLTAVIDGVLHDTVNCSYGGTKGVYGYYILK